MSVQVSYKKQFTFGVVLCLILLAAVEVTLRIYDYYNLGCNYIESGIYSEISYYDQKSMCNDYRHIQDSGGFDRQLIPNQESKTVHINNFGMRGPDIVKEKPDDTYRVFVIGGSTTFGSGVFSDNETIPSFLGKKFDVLLLDKKIEIINAGITGNTSIEENYRIKNELVNFQPDLFIIYDGINDVNLDIETHRDNSKLKASIQKQFLTFTQMILPEYKTILLAPFTIHKIMWDLGIGGGHIMGDSQKIDETNILEKSSLWKDRWTEICDIGHEKEFKTIVILQPIMGSGNKILTNWEYEFLQTHGGDHNKRVYDKFATGLYDLEKSCHKAIDLRNVFDDHPEQVYFDTAHVSNRGNEIVANKIFDIISPIVLEDIS